ncbi:DoxX family protein [Polaribacter marinivivus]|uniref:DoxX family protein n=1 Tax=Polaribacter marinivivus TaxID=1524260 RepID=A0ABV8R922_9FLAO
METTVFILKIIYGAFFCFAGIMHFIKPKFFNGFIPKGFPKLAVNYIVGILEFGLGFSLFLDNYCKLGAIGIIILLFGLLFIHIWDYTKPKPAIGSKKLAFIRIPFQFVLMYGAYLIYLNS